MARKNKPKIGRPKAEIDAAMVLKMAQWGAKTVEIADFFNVSVDTIDNRFSEILEKGRSELKMSLRQWQLTAAKNGNATMLVWLGKQMLGQKDNLEISNAAGEGFKVIVEEYKAK
jgi:hypothetical protein